MGFLAMRSLFHRHHRLLAIRRLVLAGVSGEDGGLRTAPGRWIPACAGMTVAGGAGAWLFVGPIVTKNTFPFKLFSWDRLLVLLLQVVTAGGGL